MVFAPGCDSESAPIEEPATNDPAALELHERAAPSPDDPIEPLPLTLELDARKVALGGQLFDDPILSPGGDVTCTTCHVLARGGVDRRRKSVLAGHSEPLVNTPTIFNLAFNFRYHWGGSFDELTAELKVPIESGRAMATTFDDIVKRLRASETYPRAFREIYADGVTVDTFKDAMVEYERSLYTPNARFDRYLRGDEHALTPDEKAGYGLFKNYGCISCHQGINIGGNMFQKLGVMRDYFEERGVTGEGDFGRYNVTKKESDRHVFRVPSLRNVAVTAPYFHDGSAETLEQAVQVMAEYQLGRPLSSDQSALIVAFLETLTGEYLGKPLQ